MKDNQINTLLAVGLVTAGIIVAAKNYKRDGFWQGALAAFLISGLTITVGKMNKQSTTVAVK